MRENIQSSCIKIRHIIENSTSPDDSLLGGKSGRSIYYAYLYKITEDEKYLNLAASDLGSIFDKFGSYKPRIGGASFSIGAAGFAYMVSHLNNNELMDFDMDSDFESIDKYLFDNAIKFLKNGEADYLHQALGILHYFNTRLPNKNIEYFIQEIVIALNNTMVKDDLGYRIISSFGPRKGKSFDFSLAHGLSGLISILCDTYSNGYQSEILKSIINGSIDYLLNFFAEPKDEDLSYLPLTIEEKTLTKEKSNMLAWCYGDLGPTMSLYKAYKIFKNEHWKIKLSQIEETLHKRVKIEGNLVVNDSHFCHGSSGVAQFFLKLYEISEHKPYLKAYEKWIAHTQKLLELDLDNKFYVGKESGLLEGLLGVGLTLETFLYGKPLNWSKALLL